MLRTSESETEILLGNKQIFGIFFVVAILLGIAFYGGYMVGKAAPQKSSAPSSSSQTATSASTTPAAPGETHTLPGDTSTQTQPNPTDATEPEPSPSNASPLGTPKAKKAASRSSAAEPTPSPQTTDNFAPQPGQQFLQVTAVGHDEALGVARVLVSQGFHAHAVPKPGNPKLYRVLVGPLRDAGEISTTRDSLRKTGFREVIIQRY